ncbi:MAG: NADH-quinone oxidoreductase subunit J [Gemmatimonadota bacterium]|nr:NADH-quinone oxidoreductase subunit J [Gemmatimonadota bacterium]
MTEVVFYVFAAIAVVSAMLCILQRNAVAAALWLVNTMFSLAAIYVLLNAQFIAAIQVLVYAGAIMVLFLFVIMLLNVSRAEADMRGSGTISATIVLVGLLAIALLGLWHYTPDRLAADVAGGRPEVTAEMGFPLAGEVVRQSAERGVVGAVAEPLFMTYLIPFEITSVLLLAAMVGAVVLAKRRI